MFQSTRREDHRHDVPWRRTHLWLCFDSLVATFALLLLGDATVGASQLGVAAIATRLGVITEIVAEMPVIADAL